MNKASQKIILIIYILIIALTIVLTFIYNNFLFIGILGLISTLILISLPTTPKETYL